jgi:hypothetical protein
MLAPGCDGVSSRPSSLPSVRLRRVDVHKYMKVKSQKWFAAGPEVSHALMVLSDGAFRLYFYLCMQAKRESGSLAVNYVEVARVLSRSRRSISTYFEELRRNGVCRIYPAANQHRSSQIEFCDEYWPYTRLNSGSGLPSQGQETYLLQIRSLLDARACIRCAFGAADQKFATALFESDITVDQIERGIALGCSRKYVSLLNGTESGEIVSFCYFRDLIDEAGDQATTTDYWGYLKLKLKRYETQWCAMKGLADANIASATEQNK